MQIHEGMIQLWERIRGRKCKILLGLSIWSIIYILGWLLGEIIDGFQSQFMMQGPDPLTFIITGFTSLFLHKDLNHLSVNLTAFYIYGIILFAFLDIIRGSKFIIIIGFIARILEGLFYTCMLFCLRILEEHYFTVVLKATSWEPWTYYPIKGLGASGALVGLILVSLLGLFSFQGKKLTLMKFKSRSYSFEEIVYFGICGIGLFVVFSAICSDLINFLAVYGSYFQIFIFNDIFLNLSRVEGNPYLGHIMGLFSGYFVGYFIRFNSLINSETG